MNATLAVQFLDAHENLKYFGFYLYFTQLINSRTPVVAVGRKFTAPAMALFPVNYRLEQQYYSEGRDQSTGAFFAYPAALPGQLNY